VNLEEEEAAAVTGQVEQRQAWRAVDGLPASGLAGRASAIAGIAGIAGPILFTVAFAVQERFRVGDHDPVAEPVSALEAGPGGWVQQVNFVVLGLLIIAFAFGLHRGVLPSRAGLLGPALLVARR
jgi:hypothetical protein